jgi:hypothetical protein
MIFLCKFGILVPIALKELELIEGKGSSTLPFHYLSAFEKGSFQL